MNLEQGDAFEAEQRDWIRKNFLLYETVWSEFIGHDGHGHPLPLPGLSVKQESDRRKFYQAHYSMVLSCFQIDATCREIDSMGDTAKDVTRYLREIEFLNSFVNHVGRVYDMVKDMAEALAGHDPIRAPFHRFFGFRSHALHAARIPLRRDEYGLLIPKISWSEKQDGEWNDASLWEAVDWTKACYMTDLCRDVRADLFKTINDIYPLIRSKAHEYFGRTVEPKPASTATATFTDVSGYTYFPQISGSANLR
jgi:hypothetical protein